MIRAVGITQHYGVRPVLRNVNFEVNAGELVALMGPNGMGKSTLLGVLAGMLSPQKGYVEIDGLRRRRTEDEEQAIRRRVAYLPEPTWLPKTRTAREYLMAVGRLYEVDDEQLMDHIDRLLLVFDLTQKGDTAIDNLSTGQKKKVAVSGALVTDAPILLLDEPFSGGLDPSGLLALKRVLARLAERNDVTVVLATPVPQLVDEIADRVLVMKDGEIVAYDTVAGLRERSGSEGTLEEVLEQLLRPETLAHIEQYFEGEGR